MANKQSAGQDALNIAKKNWQQELETAKSALEKTDKEKYPKLYAERQKLVDTLQYNENMRIRAEKAEKKSTPKKAQGGGTPKSPEYSLKDVRALSDVHDDDVDDVVEWAKFKGISVAEAKQTSHLQNLLRTKEEERKTAQASNTSGSRRGSSKVSGDKLFQEAQKTGKLPDSEDEMWKMEEARLKEKSG